MVRYVFTRVVIYMWFCVFQVAWSMGSLLPLVQSFGSLFRLWLMRVCRELGHTVGVDVFFSRHQWS